MPHASIPTEQLLSLEFLVGEFVGIDLSYALGPDPLRRSCSLIASREACDRFLQLQYASDVVENQYENFTGMVTFNRTLNRFEMWLFCLTSEEPVFFTGECHDASLVLISEPQTIRGELQRVRLTFAQHRTVLSITTEVWTLDGYVTIREAFLREQGEVP